MSYAPFPDAAYDAFASDPERLAVAMYLFRVSHDRRWGWLDLRVRDVADAARAPKWKADDVLRRLPELGLGEREVKATGDRREGTRFRLFDPNRKRSESPDTDSDTARTRNRTRERAQGAAPRDGSGHGIGHRPDTDPDTYRSSEPSDEPPTDPGWWEGIDRAIPPSPPPRPPPSRPASSGRSVLDEVAGDERLRPIERAAAEACLRLIAANKARPENWRGLDGEALAVQQLATHRELVRRCMDTQLQGGPIQPDELDRAVTAYHDRWWPSPSDLLQLVLTDRARLEALEQQRQREAEDAAWRAQLDLEADAPLVALEGGREADAAPSAGQPPLVRAVEGAGDASGRGGHSNAPLVGREALEVARARRAARGAS